MKEKEKRLLDSKKIQNGFIYKILLIINIATLIICTFFANSKSVFSNSEKQNTIPSVEEILRDYDSTKGKNQNKHFLKVVANYYDIEQLKSIVNENKDFFDKITYDDLENNWGTLKASLKNLVTDEQKETSKYNILLGYLAIMQKANELIYTTTEPILEPENSTNRFLDEARSVKLRMEYLTLMYYTTEDTKYAERAWTEIDNACNWNNKWQSTEFLDTSEMVYAISMGYDGFYNYLTEKQREKIETTLINNGLVLYCKTINSQNFNDKTNNWNQVCNGGIGVAAISLLDKDLKIYLDDNYNITLLGNKEVESGYIDDEYIKQIIKSENLIQEDGKKYITLKNFCGAIIKKNLEQLPLALNDFYAEGSYPEGPVYYSYGMSYFMFYLSTLKNATGSVYNLLNTDINLNNIVLYPIYASNNSNIKFNYADSASKTNTSANITWIANECAKIANNNDADSTKALYCWKKKFETSGFNYYSLIWYEPQYDVSENEIDYEAILNRYIYHNKEIDIESIGNAVFRTNYNDKNSIYVGLKGQSNADKHSHLDLGSFVFDALGRRWIEDFGAQSYTTNYFSLTYWRWQYYRARAEGHSTIVINPKVENTKSYISDGIAYNFVEADQYIYGKAVFTKFESQDNASIAVVDLADAYNKNSNNQKTSSTNKNTVYRGIKLLESKKYMILQDEVYLEKESDYYSFFNVSSDIKSIDIYNTEEDYEANKSSENGNIVVLTDSSNQKLKLKLICTNENAKFEKMKKVALNSFLNEANNKFDYTANYGQTFNEKDKLVIHVENAKDLTMSIAFIPLYNGKVTFDFSEKNITSLNNWYIPQKPTITAITENGDGINNSNKTFKKVQVKLTANKENETLKYSLDGGATWEKYTNQLSFSDAGLYTILAKSEDKTGTESNLAEISFEILEETVTEKLTSTQYTVDEEQKILTDVELETTVDIFKTKISGVTNYTIKDKNGK
ncbi:MAG: DUF4962 domain-containing protein, partial [Clostridia bacterium]|nr:DUF4962 domain-containing protein [Clostridia bacterium]